MADGSVVNMTTSPLELWHGGARLFARHELACRATGEGKLAGGFGGLLIELRVAWDRPMKVLSCCRSKAHNDAPISMGGVGGHLRSLHVYDQPPHGLDGCAAIDIAVADTHAAGLLAFLAWRMGWSVGVPRGFLHLDRRDLAGLKQALFGY